MKGGSWQLLLLLAAAAAVAAATATTWAIIAATSRHWYNYRHTSNALSIFHAIRKAGVPDSNIILLLAGDIPCGVSNPLPGQVIGGVQESTNVYDGDFAEDLSGDWVGMRRFMQMLTGRQAPWVGSNKRLNSDENSNVLIYITGHGGENFIQWQRWDTLAAGDLAAAVSQLQSQRRFRKLLVMLETCQAESMFTMLDDYPDVLAIGSSKTGQSSYSRLDDAIIGAPLTDKFSAYTLSYLEFELPRKPDATLRDMVKYLDFAKIGSNVVVHEGRNFTAAETRIADFFAEPQLLPRLIDDDQAEVPNLSELWPL